MAYKIVQTVERGKLVLTAVPDKWEENGVLYWPRRKVEDLLKDPFSRPEESWSSLQCVVKRRGIISLESAEIEITQMSSMSDTEDEQNARGCISNKNIGVQECFNDIANACVNNEYLQSSTYNATTDNDVVVLTTNLPNQETDQPQNVTTLHTDEINQQSVSQKLDYLLHMTNIIQENHKVLFEYVQSVETKLLMKMSDLSTLFDEYVQHTIEIKTQELNDFKKIYKREELDAFEEQLKDANIGLTLKNKLAVVCGNGKGRGSNNAYALVDVMFTRQFMTTCSWAGGSKSSLPKICFKFYTKTINFFFELIHESYKTYTKIECENFFKNIMRHAETRNKIKLLRTSSTKSRPKRNMPKTKTTDSLVLQEIQQNDSNSNLINIDHDKKILQ